MAQLNGLPLYQLTLDETDSTNGVEFISLVDEPAIEVDWIAFKNQKIIFSKSDEQILLGAVMIPSMPIYRADQTRGEYYVNFTEQEIKKIAYKFLREGKTLEFNYQHKENSKISGVQIIESWFITDKENDKSKSYGFDLPVGTWMCSVHITDSDFWNNEIKTKNVRGFSIEGYLNMKMSKLKNNKMMNKLKFESEIKTADGIVLHSTADAFDVGVDVYIVDEAGVQTAATDGDYKLDDDSIIKVKDGKVSEVISAEVESTNMALTPEDVDAINQLFEPFVAQIDELTKRIEKLESENTAMSAKFSTIAGTKPATTKVDVKVSTKLSLTDKLKNLQAIVNEKNNKK